MDQAPGGGAPGAVAAQGAADHTVAPDELRRDLAALGLEDLTEIASGGFATVYRARQPAMGREVAVKVLTAPVTDRLVRSRFQRECQALGLLSDHPAIVTVFDAGFTASGRPYLVMELMSGGSLAEQVAAQGPLGWSDVLTVGVRIAGALHSAHSHGVLHRDVKPANILISEYGAPHLGDFGIARLQGAEHTSTGALTGSLAHAAPELLGGGAPSVRSDVYALGSTLFTLLHGQTAFLHPTDESIIPALARITTSAIPDLRLEGVPAAVCDVVEQLMAKRTAERPETAADAGRALQEAQRALDVPVTALPVVEAQTTGAVDVLRPAPDVDLPPPPTRSRRWALVTAAVVVLTAIAGAFVLLSRPPAPQPDPGTGSAPAPTTLDVTRVAAQIREVRGLPADGAVTASLVPRADYDARIRAWATAGRDAELRREQRILAALHLIPDDTDLVAVTQDLYAEQFLGFSTGRRITIRADAAELSPLQQAVIADETAGVLLDQRHDVTAEAERLADPDARRAWLALHRGDTALTAAAWSERFLTAEDQRQRATELSAQPDRIARGLPEALRAELVFPYVAGEAFVRALLERGGVAAVDRAYADPPATSEQLLHPAKYRSREPAVPVRIPATAPSGWTVLAEQTVGEFDVRRLTAVLGSQRSATAAAGWGGGQLRAWERGSDTAVRISLVFDRAKDGRQACTALRDAHQQRAAAIPTSPDVLVTAGDAFVQRCAGAAVDLAVAPDQVTAAALLEP